MTSSTPCLSHIMKNAKMQAKVRCLEKLKHESKTITLLLYQNTKPLHQDDLCETPKAIQLFFASSYYACVAGFLENAKN